MPQVLLTCSSLSQGLGFNRTDLLEFVEDLTPLSNETHELRDGVTTIHPRNLWGGKCVGGLRSVGRSVGSRRSGKCGRYQGVVRERPKGFSGQGLSGQGLSG